MADFIRVNESKKITATNFSRAFTLVELLVVISIISFLSSIVLASLNSARSKAQEAAIKADLMSIKTQAELSYNNFGNYSNVPSEITNMLAHINANGGTASFTTIDGTHYSVSAKLNSGTSKNLSISDGSGLTKWDSLIWSGSWDRAKMQCANLGGRLPTLEELLSLNKDYGDGVGIPPDAYIGYYNGYFTSTEYPADPINQVYVVYSYHFNYLPTLKTNSSTYRCVY